MDKSRTDDWRSLCELASKENDPQKLLDLITRVNRVLDECSQQRQKLTKHYLLTKHHLRLTQPCCRPTGTAHTIWISTFSQENASQPLNTTARGDRRT